MKKFLLILTSFLFFFIQNLAAQGENPDFMRSIGKIYVVVGVIVTIFICIVIFLFRMDSKLTKLENQIKEHE